MRPVSYMASVAATASLSAGDFRQIRIQLVADAALAIAALTIATLLSIYKPQGLTPYGRRVYADRASVTDTLPWSYVWTVGVMLIALLFALVHLAGLGLHVHGHR
jgi:hypothetical protein